MVRLARVCLALVLLAAASTTHAATTTAKWETDYKSWMADIKASVAGNADLEKKAAELETQIDAAIVAGVPEEERMRMLYNFLGLVDKDTTFVGFTTKSATTTTAAAPAATNVPAPAPTPSSAASSLSLASLATVAVAAVGYALM